MSKTAYLRLVDPDDGSRQDEQAEQRPAFVPVELPDEEPLFDRSVWIGLLLAALVNTALVGVLLKGPVATEATAPQTVEFTLVEPPPPPPEPEPEPEPEPPKVVDFQEASKPLPTDTATTEPEAEPPPPVFGVSMESTVAAGEGSFAVRVGNTLMKKPEEEFTPPEDVRALPRVSFQRLDDPPRIIRDFRAPYPEEAQAGGFEGTVILKLTIDENGKVVEARIVRGIHPELDAAAKAAAKRFVFRPGRSNGEPVVTTNYVYRYTWLIED